MAISQEKLRKVLALMNIAQVARGAGISASSIHRFIDGESSPRYETVIKIIAYLEQEGVIENG